MPKPTTLLVDMTLRRAALLVLAISLSACAASPPPAAAPPAASYAPGMPPPAYAPGEPPPPFQPPAKGAASPVDSEMLAIAKLEDEIDRLFPSAGKGPSRKKADKADEAKPAEKAPAKDAKEESLALSGGVADACATACKALSSMQSSADHLCKLAGEGDGRCEDARGRVRGAGTRVRAVCPTCSVGVK
ncbi:MAG: hypothetical protein QM820_13160 [Minicystis sp.]